MRIRNQTLKIAILSVLFVGMSTFVGYMFYVSEPQYIDNPSWKPVKKWDIVALNAEEGLDAKTGIVLQIDSTSSATDNAFLKDMGSFNTRYFHILLSDTTRTFRIVGKGTFYHKVNTLVGFNLCFITVGIAAIFLVIILVSLIRIIGQLLDFEWLI